MNAILLPTDFSENSWNAIVYALHFFRDTSCNFYLLHINRSRPIAPEYLHTEHVMEVQKISMNSVKTQLLKLIDTIETKFPNTKHRYFAVTDQGFFIESIRRQVDEKKIDMIVMGTKGASGLKRLVIGSNTGAVITKVKCTTLIVPEKAAFNTLDEISFPTDFSLFYGVKTLEPIFEILERFNSSLRILHMGSSEKNLNMDQLKNKEFLNDYLNNRKHSFHFLSNKKIEESVQCFVESRNIDLIAMVAKNLNYFQQILFHSKVQYMSYHTHVPFLVLHEK
ncbi:MAG TPA: universal stress protein [Aquaticitalea sp.]|nr:universal stress protein [Aquaticitalea sp.]